MRNPFRQKDRAKVYQAAVECYQSKHRDLFLADGTRRGAHRYSLSSNFAISFWDGYDGKEPAGGWSPELKRMLRYPAWCAGRDIKAVESETSPEQGKPTEAETSPIGRWLDTVTDTNMPRGDLIWLPAPKSGLRSHVATMAGRAFAVVRPVANRQWNVRIAGFVWFEIAMPEGSAARLMNIRESAVGGFPSIAKAKAAVSQARRLLDEHLRQRATQPRKG